MTDTTTIKYLAAALATILTFAAFVPYIYSILKGRTKPHVFSFVIFSLTTLLIFCGQLADGGGLGAWPIGISGLITCIVAVLAYIKKSDNSITRTDWIFFLTALSAIPLWLATADPMWSVLLLVFIEVLGLMPTLRKAYDRPYEEQMALFIVMAVRNLISIIALENYSITTLAFPVVISVFCAVITVVIIYRRMQVEDFYAD